jgi:hypothetical protein
MNKKIIKIGSLVLLLILIFSAGVLAGGGSSGKKYGYTNFCSRSNFSCSYTGNYRKNKSNFDQKYERWTEISKDKTYNHYHSFKVTTRFNMYLDYALDKGSQGDARIWIQKYDGGWKTVFYSRHFKGNINSKNVKFISKELINLSPGNYRIRARAYGKNGGFFHRRDHAEVAYSYGIVKEKAPEITTSVLSYKENEYQTNIINVAGGNYNLKCSGDLLSGMKISATSNGCNLSWRADYSINKNTSSSNVRKLIKVYVENSGGKKVSKNIPVYVTNTPYPISNINYRDYKDSLDLPSPKINYSIPSVPKFDSSNILNSHVSLTDITRYVFKEVEETPPHPGDKPFMLTAKESSLVAGTNEEINRSLTIGDVKGYDSFKKELVEFNKARNAYESLEHFLNTQYKESEIENKKPFNKGLESIIKYNKNKNNLGKPLNIEDYKDYSSMEEIYNALRKQLQERQNKMDYNMKQYNKYKDKVNNYNSELESEIDKLINKFTNSYISEFKNWKNKRENYLYNLKEEVDGAIIYNNDLYNSKKEEIKKAIEYYGMVSLEIKDITKKPSENSLREYLTTQKSLFDNNIKIPNIYDSLKDNRNISLVTKNTIKNKFSDGEYNTSKLNWLSDIIEKDLKIEIKKPIEYNEKYLLE